MYIFFIDVLYKMSINEEGFSKIMVIHSEDRLSGSGSRFRVHIGSAGETHRVSKVVLKSLHAVNSVYNITSNNNVLDITSSVDGNVVVTVTPGFYTASELSTEIETQANAVFITNALDMTLDPNTLKFTFDATPSLLTINAVADDMYYELGFDSSDIPVGPVDPIVVSNVPRLNGLSKIYLHSVCLSNGNSFDSKEQYGNLFTVIPVDAKLADPITFRTDTEDSYSIVYNTDSDVSELDISLTDENNIDLDFNGSPVTLVFKIYYHR